MIAKRALELNIDFHIVARTASTAEGPDRGFNASTLEAA
jgi:hypothetical protein